MSTHAIEVRDVSKAYPGVKALSDVSFSVGPSEVVGLVGHNGAGKSTLTRILGGVERPDGGTVEVGGEEVAFGSPDDAITAGVCVVPQHLSIVPVLSIEENIGLGTGRRARSDGSPLRERIRLIAAQLGLEGQLKQKALWARPSTQRLVMIARALLREPKVMLLDEPTAALHPSEVARVFEVIDGLRREGMAIVFISHRLEEVLRLTSRVTVMRQGRVVAEQASATLDKDRLGELIAGREIQADAERSTRSATAADVLLRCEGLVRLPSVRRVSLELRRGEILGLAGLAGSGRTQVLRMIAGLERPDEGELTVKDKPVGRSRRSAIRAGVAYLPDDRVNNGVVPEMTVAATVTLSNDRSFRVHPWLPLLRHGREAAIVDEVLARLDLHPRGAASRKMKHLSGGNQQKALMARALLAGADVYLFDEPTEGVDVGARQDLHNAIRQLAADGAAVIVSSSESDEIVALADRVIVMYDGVSSRELNGCGVTEAAVTQACLVG
jgi:ribose transport system ATP-binding protein